MQYKRLSESDFVTGYGSITEPIGTGGGGQVTLAEAPTVYKCVNNGANDSENFRYKQIANIIQGDATQNLPIGGTVYVHSFNRKDFKNGFHPSSFNFGGSRLLTGSNDVKFCEAGRVYKNSGGTIYAYPDIGFILTSTNLTSGGNLKVASEEIITTSHVYIRARNKEFNYSTNPSFSDIQGNIRFRELKDNPVVYITTVGLYNDNGDLLAVAKVPTPIKKTFHDEVLIQVQLDF